MTASRDKPSCIFRCEATSPQDEMADHRAEMQQPRGTTGIQLMLLQNDAEIDASSAQHSGL